MSPVCDELESPESQLIKDALLMNIDKKTETSQIAKTEIYPTPVKEAAADDDNKLANDEDRNTFVVYSGCVDGVVVNQDSIHKNKRDIVENNSRHNSHKNGNPKDSDNCKDSQFKTIFDDGCWHLHGLPQNSKIFVEGYSKREWNVSLNDHIFVCCLL